jgi:Putative metallopeptidase
MRVVKFTPAVALAFATVALVGQSHRALSQDLQNSMVDIAYVEPANPEYRPIYEQLKKRQVLEELREFLAPLRLPRKLLVQIAQCDADSRPYTEGGPVTICYEYVQALGKLAQKIPPGRKTARGVSREDAVVGGFVQAVLNGTSHAVFDILEIPVWGREEDSADKLAGYLMLQFGTDTARTLLNGAAFFFEASDRTWTGSDFADTRGTEAQRFYNYLCIAYGGDPKAFRDFVEAGGAGARPGQRTEQRIDLLPQHRAERCPKEYNDLQYAFNQTIMPFVDQDMLAKVLARRDWLRPNDGK